MEDELFFLPAVGVFDRRQGIKKSRCFQRDKLQNHQTQTFSDPNSGYINLIRFLPVQKSIDGADLRLVIFV